MTRRALLRGLLALLAGAAAFAIWWRTMDGPRAFSVAKNASPPLLLAAVALLAGSQVARIVRWAYLLRRVGNVTLGRTFRLLAAGEFVNTFLPVRIGEVGRIVALAGTGGFTAGSATASVVVDRLWGVGVRLLVIPLVLLVPGKVPRPVAVSAALFAAAALVALAALAVHARRPALSAAVLRLFLLPVPRRFRPPVERSITSFADAALAMNLSPGAALALFAMTAGGLLVQAGASACFFAAAGAPLSAPTVIAGVALVDLLAIVPSPPAGLGSAEWYVTLVFSIGFGAPLAETAAAALLLHASWILLVTLAGAAAIRTIGEMVPRRRAAEAREGAA